MSASVLAERVRAGNRRAPRALAPPLPGDGDELQGEHRYRLGAVLGEGGAGRVHEAIRLDTSARVAIKLLREDAPRGARERARLRARFRRETALCARLSHPHIVALLDSGETPDGLLFAVFEHVAGRTLRALLAADGALAAETTGALMAQVLDGLAHAHENGVVHRDLKPQNVMVTTRDGEPCAKILDFGIGALLPDAHAADELTLTATTEVLGSPQYCAPEQLRGEPPTAKSDFYAWGLIVIECLTGHPVMQGASLADVLYQHLSPVDVALPPAIAAHPLGDVLRDALNKDPRQRAESAQALANRFRAIHFPALVGGLRYGARHGRRAQAEPGVAAREPGGTIALDAPVGRRQVTALCCRVSVVSTLARPADAAADDEALDAFHAHWLTRCSDIAVRYGGHVAGALGDTLLFYFGYPEGIDRPAQRACRAALEMTRHAGQPAGAPRSSDGDARACAPAWRIDIAGAIHVGTAFATARGASGGVLASAALGLQRIAQPGGILLSDEAARALERHVDAAPTALTFAAPGAAPQPVRELLGERYERGPFESLELGDATPIVGRDREQAALARAWRDAVRAAAGGRRARRRATLVVGEPGIGKSRLVHALRELVRAQRGACAACVCLPEQTNHALFPILRFVRAHWQLDVGDPHALDRMLEAFDGDRASARATLAAWLGLPGGADTLRWSGARQQQALFDVLCQLLGSLGGGGPVLLIVDDVQWCDSATDDFLDALAHHPACAAVCVVLTSRPERLERWRRGAERLMLRRLSAAATRNLIVSLMPGAGTQRAALDFLVKRTGGVPLYVEETVRALAEGGVAPGAGARLPDLAQAGRCPLPGSLRETLELALERADDALDTVQLAATIGLEVDARLLAEASPHAGAELDERLRRLIEGRVLYAQHRIGGATYVFRHALLREAAYESMPAATRREYHRRVAQALLACVAQGDPAARSASIADHFARAHAFAAAVPHGIEAARRALARALHDDAIRYAGAVRGWLLHCDYPGQHEDAVSVDLTLAHAQMARDGWGDPRVREHTDRVLSRVGELSDAKAAAGALWTIAVYHHVAGDRDAVRRIGGQLSALARASARADLGVAADTLHGMALWIDGHYTLALDAFDAALAAYDPRRDGDHRHVFGLDTRAWAQSARACVLWGIDDDVARTLALARDAVQLATCTDHLPTIGLTMMYLARMQQCVGDREGARATADAVLRLSRCHGLNAVERYAAVVRAWCDGDRDAARANVDALRASGCMLGLTYYASVAADIDAERGDARAALATLDECLALAESMDERHYVAELLLKKARCVRDAHGRRAADEAQALCARAAAVARRSGMVRIERKAQAELRELQRELRSTTGEER
ncbi:protein kinase domain-containing protein [Burkholderia pseudomallei]|uniref:TOMM system kinase/cyclase fusion protein n=3 Tax=Burkholderia pseudomallei TaxID=28450 RepID=UPI000F0542DB|nr:TOMM system kinase/cyclase fusion protein [Burkholderia pseudomallei]MBF3497676.1 TOMM system kinase/cyclase fusion protein [Burkholderia pseudomallei]VBY34387.1 protein kinase domain-containing protein [Burkholderia pseudomallei]VBY64034.1 protein kinase domain-containing protein [Burkholderia pseudomallei]VBY70245.1 protein kinase domain-containing protein [Burkholderia pseudomallei]VBY81988.1 protein kinase domain-containing protein [Burkholderia pseudomallei]